MTYLSLFIFMIILQPNANAQKMSKKQMEARILALEEENKKLKADVEIMQTHIKMILAALPQPSKNNQPNKENRGTENLQVAADVSKMEFESTNHDFGSIEGDAVVTHIFKFKNTGTLPLQITKATASCGCTVPSWPQEPIAVGETGEIKVTFNAAGKKGNQHKSVTIIANTDPAETRLYIKASIKE